MTSTDGFPPSVILEGPVFRDELQYPPQTICDTHEVESLRLVLSKSAANGVCSVYFVPEHREWALVRLAKRYRWVLEIQLNRGLSGEQQMLRQGFTKEDIEFLHDIFPAPPSQYNPIVYDMLWLVASSDQYLSLTKAMVESETFTPRELIHLIPDIDTIDTDHFTRFLRSYLIQLKESAETNKPFSRSTDGLGIEHDETYTLTPMGKSALPGIISEYNRIFERGDFIPLFINQDLDPVEHLRNFDITDEVDETEVYLDSLQEDDGILGEITQSFTSMNEDGSGESVIEDDQTAFSPANPTESKTRTDASSNYTTSIQDRPHSPADRSFPATTTESSIPPQWESDADERQSNQEISDTNGIPHPQQTQIEANTVDFPSSAASSAEDDSQYGEFTRDEVLEATVAAARMIRSRSLVQTHEVKRVAMEVVDLNGRDTGQLWEYVSQVLLAMNSVTSRPEGRIWAGLPVPSDSTRSGNQRIDGR